MNKPTWATHQNACLAAKTVLDCGGTDERAAQAYSFTLLGVGRGGEPADVPVAEGLADAAPFADAVPAL